MRVVEDHVDDIPEGRVAAHLQLWSSREHQFEPGFPWFVSVIRGNIRLSSEQEGDAPPNTLIHLFLNDIEAVSNEFGIAIDEAGLAGREYDLEDSDGNRLRIATRRA